MTYVDMGAPVVGRPGPRGAVARRRRIVGLSALVVILVTASAASLAVGARALSPAEVWHGLFAAPDSDRRLAYEPRQGADE